VRRAGKMVGNGSRAVLTRARQSVAALSATLARRGSSRGGVVHGQEAEDRGGGKEVVLMRPMRRRMGEKGA
jgi:hypothetical protein